MLYCISKPMDHKPNSFLFKQKNRSALHYAAMGGYMDIAITLLQFGVDINRKDQVQKIYIPFH